MKTKKKTQKRRFSLKKLLGVVIAMLTITTMLAVPAFADEAATASETPAAQTAPSFGDLIGDIFEVFPTVTTGLAEGLKDSFTALIYVDPAATTLQYSPLVQFVFVMSALSLAAGLLFLIFRLIKRRH